MGVGVIDRQAFGPSGDVEFGVSGYQSKDHALSADEASSNVEGSRQLNRIRAAKTVVFRKSHCPANPRRRDLKSRVSSGQVKAKLIESRGCAPR